MHIEWHPKHTAVRLVWVTSPHPLNPLSATTDHHGGWREAHCHLRQAPHRAGRGAELRLQGERSVGCVDDAPMHGYYSPRSVSGAIWQCNFFWHVPAIYMRLLPPVNAVNNLTAACFPRHPQPSSNPTPRQCWMLLCTCAHRSSSRRQTRSARCHATAEPRTAASGCVERCVKHGSRILSRVG